VEASGENAFVARKRDEKASQNDPQYENGARQKEGRREHRGGARETREGGGPLTLTLKTHTQIKKHVADRRGSIPVKSARQKKRERSLRSGKSCSRGELVGKKKG